MNQDTPLLDPHFLRKLEYLHVVSKRVSGRFKAERRARAHGAGLEFADHRGYTPGDDFRHVDWKAYQRLERLLLRLFDEEQELPIYLLVDCSASMADAEASKLEYARKIAAALCYIGLAHLDRVTLAAYSDRVLGELRSQRGKAQIFKTLRFLAELQPGGATDSRQAIRQFLSGSRPRGVAVLISDFLDSSGFSGALDLLRAMQHDIVAVHVTRRDDARPDLRGDVTLVDSEDGDERTISVTPALLRAYAEAFGYFTREIAAYCAKYGLVYLRTDVDIAFEDAILRVFRRGRFLA